MRITSAGRSFPNTRRRRAHTRCGAREVRRCSCRTSIQRRACRSSLRALECCSGIHALAWLCIGPTRSRRACGARSIIFGATKKEPTRPGSRFDGFRAARWTTHSWSVSLNFTNCGWRRRACRAGSSRPRRYSVGSLHTVPLSGVPSQWSPSRIITWSVFYASCGGETPARSTRADGVLSWHPSKSGSCCSTNRSRTRVQTGCGRWTCFAGTRSTSIVLAPSIVGMKRGSGPEACRVRSSTSSCRPMVRGAANVDGRAIESGVTGLRRAAAGTAWRGRCRPRLALLRRNCQRPTHLRRGGTSRDPPRQRADCG